MTFAHPEWLLFLIAIPVIALASWFAWIKRGDRWKKLVAARLRNRLSSRRPAWTHFVGLGLALTGLTGLIIAFAQPESGEEWIEVDSEGRNILFCIDISRSMLTDDVSPNRLLAARAAALEVLEQFPNDRVGVLLFSGEVLVQAPLTIDHGFIEQTLAQLEPDDIPSGGSDLTRAIEQGTSLLANTGQRSNIMVIFSDGEKSSAGLDTAAAQAADSGIFIYALGFGKDGGFIPDPSQRDGKFRDRDGRPVFSKLDEESLRGIAQRTEGFYSRGIGRNFLNKLDRALDQMDRFEESGKHQRVAKPAHKWFLLGGLLFLMSSLILRCFPTRTIAVVLACFSLTHQGKAALIGDGRNALERGEYSQAHQAFRSAAEETSGERAARLHLAAGSAAFQAKNWTDAANSFSEALASEIPELQHEAHYGLATSLFYLGAPLEGEEQIKTWQGSVKHFQHALELDPDDDKARGNLKAVQTFLKKKEEKEEEKKEEEKEKSDEEKQDNQEKSEDQKEKEQKDQEGDDKKDSESQKPQEQEDSDKEQKDPESEKDKSDDEQEKQDGSPEKEGDQGKKGDKNEESEKPQPGDEPRNPEEEPQPGEGDPQQDEQDQQPQPSDDKNEKPESNSAKADQQLPEPVNESPEERARRLLKQFSDFGGKPPRQVRRPLRRSAHDW
ncbi:VWA domain-containing protein [Verrucomicrobiaceae bacterium 227]